MVYGFNLDSIPELHRGQYTIERGLRVSTR